MARIRTLKPEFWADEKLAPLPPITRLVFLGLISQADDAGRLVDNPRLIDGLLFPESDDSSRDSLETLHRLGRVLRYTSESGQRLIQITNWDVHQKVQKPSAYVLPAPTVTDSSGESTGNPPETVGSISGDFPSPIPDPRPTTYDLLPTTYDQTDGAADAPTPDGDVEPEPRPPRRWRFVPDSWEPSDSHRAKAAELGVRISVEVEKFRLHEFDKPKSDPDKAFHRWLRTAAEMGGGGNKIGSARQQHETAAVNGSDRRVEPRREPPKPAGPEAIAAIADLKKRLGHG